MPTLSELRESYHRAMHDRLFGQRFDASRRRLVEKRVGEVTYPVFTNADSHNSTSVVLCAGVADRLNIPRTPISSQGSTLGNLFEDTTLAFVTDAVQLFSHLHQRTLLVARRHAISEYAQFAHLATVQRRVKGDPELEAALGGDYLVNPDILVGFEPVLEPALDQGGAGLTSNVATYTPLRARNSHLPLLHGSISCKWTMRRDRAQNTRLEALNLVRNRKGRLPHIAAVTMECDPEILTSLCLGTGDIDCVYHGALHELLATAQEAANTLPGRIWLDKLVTLQRMVDGSRLRDISDLPPDLMI